MGNQPSAKKIGFEDIQHVVKDPGRRYLLINTLEQSEQRCLIQKTLSIAEETNTINKALNIGGISIVVYGKNANDETVYKKYEQLIALGFSNVYIYPGGMFEWMMLQDIYGADEFPTTMSELDLLRYRPKALLGIQMLTDAI